MTAPHVVVGGSYGLSTRYVVDRAPSAGETLMARLTVLDHGGKGSNQAIAAARLGAEVDFLTAVGADGAGAGAVELWDREGVKAVAVTSVLPTMTGSIVVDRHGENRIVIGWGAMAELTGEHAVQIAERIREESIVIVQNEAPLAFNTRLLQLAKERGARTVYNPAPVVVADALDAVWPLVDYLVPNATEARQLAGGSEGAVGVEPDADTAVRLALRTGCRVALTVGEHGAILTDGVRVHAIPAPKADAVDTTGAGDCFTAAFATALAAGDDDVSAVRFACRAASIAVTHPGVVDGLPRREQISESAVT